jgi:hypothetical protein
MAWSIKGDVKKNTSPSTERQGDFRDIQPLSRWKTLVWCRARLFHLSSCIFVSSDDADRFQKRSKSSGCTVSTMGLSEARGLALFQVIRGGHDANNHNLLLKWRPFIMR